MRTRRVKIFCSIRPRRLFAIVVAALLLFSLTTEGAFARGGFKGGGFRSAPTLRSSSLSRSGASGFRWGSSTARTSSSRGPSSTSRFAPSATGTRNLSSSSLYESAQRNGTLFSSRRDAEHAFRKAYGSQYTSSFAIEPSMRPAYIPFSTLVNGRNANIVYNSALGGYGYFDPFQGRWVLYDALANAATMSLLLSQHSFYWGVPSVYVSHGIGFLRIAFVLFVLFIVLPFVIRLVRAARRR